MKKTAFYGVLGFCLTAALSALYWIPASRQPDSAAPLPPRQALYSSFPYESPAPPSALVLPTSSTVPPDQVPLSAEAVLAYASNLPAASFIERVVTNADRIEVRYYADYRSYLAASPHEPVFTEEEFVRAFGSMDTLAGILMEGCTALFRRFPGTATVEIYASGPQGAGCLMSITKGSLESFYGTDLDALTTEDAFTERVKQPYWNPEGRAAYAERFITITEPAPH